jgi:hypothetical protein
MIIGPRSFGWRIIWLGLFAIAMAYVESAVVVYLRDLYYPEGFDFPLKMIPVANIWIELGREAATLVMLAAVGVLFATTAPGRFAAVCVAFGVWDVSYYFWLWVFIGWPQSLFTWDLLFLIPAPWIGPVLSPLLVSICLIIAGTVILHREYRGYRFCPPRWTWWVEIICGLLVIGAFLWNIPAVIEQVAPHTFPWLLFLVALLGGMILFVMMFRQPRFFKSLHTQSEINENDT